MQTAFQKPLQIPYKEFNSRKPPTVRRLRDARMHLYNGFNKAVLTNRIGVMNLFNACGGRHSGQERRNLPSRKELCILSQILNAAEEMFTLCNTPGDGNVFRRTGQLGLPHCAP